MGQELEELIRLADTVQDRADKSAVRMVVSQFLLLGEILIPLLVYAGLSPGPVDKLHFSFSAAVFLGFLGMVWLAAAVRLGTEVRTVERRTKVDRRALFSVVELLRETVSVQAHVEHWSPLRRARIELELARFDVGAPEPRSERVSAARSGQRTDLPEAASPSTVAPSAAIRS